jgi:pimeloyl-ACP methyl ester carboxylesterase
MALGQTNKTMHITEYTVRAVMNCSLTLMLLSSPMLAEKSDIPKVTGLSASVRSGQIFLTWFETPTEDVITYEVYLHSAPITYANLGDAQKVGYHVEAGSACDWWKNPASFDANAAEDRSHGFIIDGEELDPTSGLFVHTVVESDPTRMYFAVLPSSASAAHVVLGENSLLKPVVAAPAFPQPIQLKDGPAPGSAIGKSLTLVLHGRGDGRDPDDRSNFVLFGDAKQGWRQGLARKFIVSSDDNGITIEPRDWLWVGRPLLFSSDTRDHALAINTWWYGCNEYIYDATAAAKGVVFNYTEEHLLYLVRWAQQHFGTDPQKTHLIGTSMGGSGAIAVGFHHPNVFATIYSEVPIVAYTRREGIDGHSNLWRLDGISGRGFDETVMSNEGIPVMERMDSERIVREYAGELPFLVICNGRMDKSIPWVNNPSFYRALNQANRGFIAYWNNGAHDMWKYAPPDFTDFYTKQPMALNDSYPAFSNFSDNRNPGHGDWTDGDLVGWMNRGIYWTDLVETKNSWSLTLYAEGDFLPASLTFDLTPRKLKEFQLAPNETVWANGIRVQADATGRLTVTNIQISKDTPMRLLIERRSSQ